MPDENNGDRADLVQALDETVDDEPNVHLLNAFVKSPGLSVPENVEEGHDVDAEDCIDDSPCNVPFHLHVAALARESLHLHTFFGLLDFTEIASIVVIFAHLKR